MIKLANTSARQCEFCGGKLSNLPYVLYDNVLYEKYEFCSLKCLRSWVVRMGEKKKKVLCYPGVRISNRNIRKLRPIVE